MHLSVIDAKTATMRWVSAGHDPAILFHPDAGTFEEVGMGDLPLGVMDDTEYAEHTYGPLRPGLVILIGTDGVWEMPNAKGEPFGKDGLRTVIRESAAGSAAEIAQAIRQRLALYRGDTKQVDDVTFVIVKVGPALVG
jgi:sigma-B regulation protein RsbU (phosphoserine phosphatase)